MENASARNMWGDYLDAHLEHAFVDTPKVVYFCNDQQDANECAELVKRGIKKAISHSLLVLQCQNEPLPKIGDFMIITNETGQAQCIVRTTKVYFKPFFSIDENYARLGGEGDKSLTYWKKIHWEYYTKELAPYDREPKDSMIVVCQEFERVF